MQKTITKTLKTKVALLGAAMCVAPLVVPASSMAFQFDLPDIKTKLNIGGYVKFDAVYTDVDAGDDSMSNIELVAGAIPLSGSEGADKDVMVFNARESRLWVKTTTPSDYGAIKTHLEFDFDTSDGNQVVSNSRHPRLRHAYGTIGGWLFGQTWSTFMNLASMPETNDFGGPLGINFARQPMVRYTHPMSDVLALTVAVENGETYINGNSGGSASGVMVTDDEIMPDVIADVTWKPSWGSLSGAIMGRTLKIDQGGIDESETAFSARIGGAWKITSNDSLAGQISFGEGIGRYSSLATHTDGYLKADGSLEALEMIGASVSYQHKWNPKWRSTVALGYTQADDPAEYTGTTITEESMSVHINTFWNPVPFCRIGLEYIYAEREVYNGEDGDMNRLFFATKFVF